MQRTLEIYQIDAFTQNPFEGNPAAVTTGEGLTAEQMQLIAKEMNLSETAFISNSENADFKLQWFTPATEVKLCGHATIATLHYLKQTNRISDNSDIRFDTLSGILKCKVKDGKYFMQVPLMQMNEFSGLKEEIISVLGIKSDKLNENVPWIILGNKNLYIFVNDLSTLHGIKPDFKKMVELSISSKEFEGIVVFTLDTIDKDSFAHSRYFVPAHGIDEDPVTGSTNGPLLLVLLKLGFIKNDKDEFNYTFEQGDVLGRRGRVDVNYSKLSNKLYISGNAVTVFKGVLTF
jgi:PhzF family phenazine biosynthesis protein